MNPSDLKKFNVFLVTLGLSPRVVGFFDARDPGYRPQLMMAIKLFGPKHRLLSVYGTRARDKELVELMRIECSEKGEYTEVPVTLHVCDVRLAS